MKFFDWVESFSIPEMFMIFLFLLFVILPFQPSLAIARFFDSSLGMASLFFITLLLFVLFHPVVGIVYIFVAYEILRRSSLKTQNIPILQMPSSSKNKLNPTQIGTQSSNKALQQMRPTTSHLTTNTASNTLPHNDLLKPHTTSPLNGSSTIREGGVLAGNQATRDIQMAELNPTKASTLEEEQIMQFGPLTGKGNLTFDAPTFKPVNASKIPAAKFM